MNVIRRLTMCAAVALVAPTLTPLAAEPALATNTAQAAAGERLAPTRPLVINEPRSAPTDVSDPSWAAPEMRVPEPTTVEVDVPMSGWAKVGSTPVSIARPSGGVAVDRVRVRILSQDEVAANGGRFVGFELTRADGSGTLGAVAVSLDYSGISKAYGGNFGSRLRLRRVGACGEADSCDRALVAATNVVADAQLRAMTLPVRPDPAVAPTSPAPGSGFGPQSSDADTSMLDPLTTTTFTTTSSSSGANGDYRASQFSTSERWSVGIGSGAFTYSYPIEVPPAVAGSAPGLAINYSSQDVDGRTSESNSQPSQVGEGWSFQPGFIERRFHSCRAEGIARDDLCWSSANEYFINFMGKSGELVRTGTTSNQFRIRGNDPAWKILKFNACCSNGDNDGEYFVVILPNGTKYWFGYGIEPRSNEKTDSAWTVPVYGGNTAYAGNTTEPCYSAVSSASWCQQAYRWNVDRVLDTNDNVMSFFYDKELNKYSRHGSTALATEYTRSGYLTSIEYGQRHLAENGIAYARVRVNTMDRCITQVACPAPTATSDPTSFPDVPLDMMCTGVTCSADQLSPTFWSTKQIKSIQTEFWNADLATDAYELVSTYRFSYSFPAPGDGTDPALWLTDIEHTGEYGVGSADPVLPALRMGGVAKANRVNPGGPPMNKFRVSSVSTELGARIEVTYGQPDPCPQNTYIAPDTNPYNCYPALYEGQWIPFHKYLATDVRSVDVRGGQPDRVTHYTYVGAPAWHYADSTLAATSTQGSNQTWNDWRGYKDVRVNVEGGGSTTGTDTRYLIFRGMDGDKLANGTAKSEELVDSLGAWFNDFNYRAGLTLESKRYDPSAGHLASTLFRYWAQQTINGPNGFQSHDANFVRPSREIGRVKNTATGLWRNRITDFTYSTVTGLLTEAADGGMPDDGGADDTCSKTFYVSNTVTGSAGGDTEWIVNTPYRTQTYSDPCGTGAGAVLAAQSDFYYDDHGLQEAPTNANLTASYAYVSAGVTAVTRTTYDSHGRVTSTKSPTEVAKGAAGVATTTTYSPSTGYPYDGITTTTPENTATRLVPYFAFGTPRRVIDVSNDDTTAYVVDHYGRVTSVTQPGDPPDKPSFTFAYRVAVGVPNRIISSHLLDDTRYVTSAEYFDGLGRLVQTQLPPPNNGATGRRLINTRYDSVGHAIATTAPFGADGTVGSSDLAVVAATDIPLETRTGFDALERPYATTSYAYNVAKVTNGTQYFGWMQRATAPVRADVDYYTDVAGRVTSVVERPTGGTSTTNYTYTPLGLIDTITDQHSNVINYDYDWLGRRTKSVDPDQGTWLTTYTLDGQVESVRDAIQDASGAYDRIWYSYDRDGRKTAVSAESSGSNTLLAAWRYDNLPDGADADSDADPVNNAIGRLTAAMSYINGIGGDSHTTTITGYDNRGRVSGKRWDIANFPSSGTTSQFEYAYGYTQADELAWVRMPAAGGLDVETVTTGYNDAGLPISLTSGIGTYILDTTYDIDGRLRRHLLDRSVNRYYGYDALNRLATLKTDVPGYSPTDPRPPPETIEDLTYGYDADNNVTSIADVMAGGTAGTQYECFSYDPLNRLKRAFTTTGAPCSSASVPSWDGHDPYEVSYSHDAIGNITAATTNGTSVAYDYTGSGHAHAPKSIGGKQYSYDANGATVSRPAEGGTQTLTWTKLHQLAAVTGPGASSFVYDADGNRLLRTTGTTTTLYLDDMEVTAAPGAPVVAARYYGGSAMRRPSGMHFLLRNRQNSTAVAYDPATRAVSYQRYMPFGQRRGTTPLAATERRFLDRTEDATELIAMGARYYDAAIGRFISVDPVIDAYRPQSLAAYSYALNNPTTLADPSGLFADDPSAAGRECVSESCTPEDERNERWSQAHSHISVGAPAPESIMYENDFSDEQKKALVYAWLNSGCAPGSVNADFCQGVTQPLLVCQLDGHVACAESAAQAAEIGDLAATAMMSSGGVIASGVRKGTKGVRSAGGRMRTFNRAGKPYPNAIDPRTGKPIFDPGPNLEVVPKAQRVKWGTAQRNAFKAEWARRGYAEPSGGWDKYDIHHIIPREYGGTNDFDNLVPVLRPIHQQQLNPWWNNY